jgi:hypothetical protein
VTARLAILALALVATGCWPEENELAQFGPVARVLCRSAGEEALAHVVLEAAGEARLGISSAAAERRPMPRTRRFGGEVVVPTRLPGREGWSLVVGGALTAADRARDADALIAADEATQHAHIEVEAAAAAFARAERIQKAEAGSVRGVEEARARLVAARATLRAAQARRDALAAATFGGGDPVWVRVPVYVGDLEGLASEKPALVTAFGASPGPDALPATPVAGPRAGNPDAASVDVFYAVENRDARLRPGEKVLVTIELRGEDETLVVPWSAVVHDVHGGEWVYENTHPHVFVRRRVQVRSVVGPEAALASGPSPGASIVVTGAAELFGVEFGTAAGTED